MFIQEPQQNPYDLNFRFMGYPTRVSLWFWVMALALGWSWCQSIDRSFVRTSPGPVVLLLIWCAGVFISILVHELGHSLMMNRFGIRSRIVLYHFGGLAIPESMSWRSTGDNPRESLLISLAGPVLQLLLGLIVYAVAVAMRVPTEFDIAGWLHIPVPPPERIEAVNFAIFDALIRPSIFWALLNLMPVLPMDGGNILFSGLRMARNVDQPRRIAHVVSMAVAGLVAYYFMFHTKESINGMLFLFLAFSNYQAMQFTSHRF